MKQMLTILASCLLLTILLFPHTASAAAQGEAVGTVVAVRGEVVAVSASGAERHLALKGDIFREDSIRTGNGRIQLMFADNTLISLGRQSEMMVAEYDWQPDGKSGAMKTRIKEGTFRVMGGAITKVAPGNFSTETPAATIGIRGSMYAGKATPDSLMVVFQGGKGIDVANAAGTVGITRPGFGTRVLAPDRPPLPPVRFTAQDLQELNKGLEAEKKQDEEGGQEQDTSSEEDGSGQDENDGGEPASDGDDPDNPGDDPEEADPQGWSDEPLPLPPPDDPDPGPVPPAPPSLPPPPKPTPDPPSLPVPGAASYPTSGIHSYYGDISHWSSHDSGNDRFWMEINWQNNALLGRVWDPDHETGEDESVYFFGHYDRDDPSLSRIFIIERHKRYDRNIEAIWGKSTYADFTGEGAENFQFTAAGGEYAMAGLQNLKSSWEAAGSGTLKIEPELPFSSPTKFQGFIMGKADNMANPSGDYRLFMNSDPGEFSLGIDTTRGTFSGSLGAASLDGSMNLGVTVGGSNGSVYVLDDQFLGIIGSGATGLKTYGNFLVTAHPDIQHQVESGVAGKESEYLSWGYWEIAYQRNGNDYHVFSDQGYWIAGTRTPQKEVEGLIANHQVGHYQGGAIGIKIANGRTFDMEGASDITVDFGAREVNGKITLDRAFTFGPAPLETNGSFSCPGGQINGALYGPNAAAIGGNFNFQYYNSPDTEYYYGIFGGMKR